MVNRIKKNKLNKKREKTQQRAFVLHLGWGSLIMTLMSPDAAWYDTLVASPLCPPYLAWCPLMWLWMTMAFCLKNLKFLLHRKPLMFLWMVTAAQVWVLLHFSSSCWYRSSLRNTYHRYKHTHTHTLKHADTRGQNPCHKLGVEAPWWVPAGTVPPRYRTCPAEPPSALCLTPQGAAGSGAPRIWNATLPLTLCFSKFLFISRDQCIYLAEKKKIRCI